MKHQSAFDILQRELAQIGAQPSSASLRRLTECLEYLYPAAFRFGLTNYPDLAEFTRQLVCPALWILPSGAETGPLTPLLDFGAGSGAVGIALAALLTDSEVILADRRARVVQFLDLTVKRLGLTNCKALQVDLEAPPAELIEAVGTVLIRAFGPTGPALSHAERLLRPEGAIALWHQPPSPPPPGDLHQVGTLQTSVHSLLLTTYKHRA